jgi:hypothetical protein
MRPSLHALVIAAALAVGCAGPRPGPEHAAVSPPSAVAPGDELERELLRRLPELPAEQPVAIDDATVTARAPYSAASGRTCRALTILGAGAAPVEASGDASGGASRSRLACREDGDWFFVPQIFRSEVPETSHGP